MDECRMPKIDRVRFAEPTNSRRLLDERRNTP
jgi:hypothetical protein